MWWIGSARSGREFEVRDAILGLGGYAWVAREFATVRPPKMKRHVAVTRPLQGMGKYVVIQCSDETWHKLREVKHLAATMLSVNDAAARRYIEPFMNRVDVDFAERKARFDAGERIEAYQPGDLFRIIAGPLEDFVMRLEKVRSGGEEFADKLVGKVDIFGRATPVELDPMHVELMAAE